MPVRMVSDDDSSLNSSDNNSGGGLMNIFNNFMDPSDNNQNFHDTSGGGGIMNMISGLFSNNSNVNNSNFNISDITNLFHNSQNSNGQIDFNSLRDNISNHPNGNNPDWLNTIASVVKMFKK